jgi:hypothetical protein
MSCPGFYGGYRDSAPAAPKLASEGQRPGKPGPPDQRALKGTLKGQKAEGFGPSVSGVGRSGAGIAQPLALSHAFCDCLHQTEAGVSTRVITSSPNSLAAHLNSFRMNQLQDATILRIVQFSVARVHFEFARKRP